jgi:hypothetical protein
VIFCATIFPHEQSLHVLSDGEGSSVGYLLYDGAHYDPLVVPTSSDEAGDVRTSCARSGYLQENS